MRKIFLYLLFCFILCVTQCQAFDTWGFDSGSGTGASVSDTAYDATTWDNVTDAAPSKNAVRDKFEAIGSGTGDLKADGSVPMTGVLTGVGVEVKNGATSSGFVDFFEDSDNGTSYYRLYGADSLTGNIFGKLPTLAGAIGEILYYSGSNQMANLTAGATGKLLIGKGAAAPEWTPYTLPSTVPTVGKVLISDGTNMIGSTALGTGAYATIANYLPLSTIVATGDIIVGSGAGTATVITKGAASTLFGVNGAGTLGFYGNIQQDDSAAQFYNLADVTKLFGIDVSGISANVVGWFKPQVTVTGKKYIFTSISADTYIPSGNVTLSGPTTTNRTITVPDANVTSPFEDRLVAYFNGGGTTVIVANEKLVIVVPFPCVITGGVITASKKLGTPGVVSAVVDIWKESTFADYDGGSSHPAVADTIVGGGGTKPTVTADNSSLISVTGWATTTLAKGDILIFNADSITDTVIATVTLYVSRR